MAGTRTAPTVNGTPTFKKVSVTLYDYTGDQRTVSNVVDADTTDADVEAYIAQLQSMTNATIWRVEFTDVYGNLGDKGNAVEEVWENINDNQVTLMKAAAGLEAQDWYIPSPINAMYNEGTETIDPDNALYAAYLVILTAFRAGSQAVSTRMTHRRQKGKSQRI